MSLIANSYSALLQMDSYYRAHFPSLMFHHVKCASKLLNVFVAELVSPYFTCSKSFALGISGLCIAAYLSRKTYLRTITNTLRSVSFLVVFFESFGMGYRIVSHYDEYFFGGILE